LPTFDAANQVPGNGRSLIPPKAPVWSFTAPVALDNSRLTGGDTGAAMDERGAQPGIRAPRTSFG
jgi:hypothetical protein